MYKKIARGLLLVLICLVASVPAQAQQPQLMLAKHWDESIDPTGWLISEKYDGIRAYWNGKQLLSKKGNPLNPPDWFIERMPSFPLDGELWMGRGKFEQLLSVVKNYQLDRNRRWNNVLFMVFDAPKLPGDFSQRHADLSKFFKKRKADHIRLVPQKRCKGKAHLLRELERVERRGGEGLMIRQPHSIHIAGRSAALLKVKSWHDAEAEVIGHVKGQGRYTGLMGALQVKMPNGQIFNLGSGFSTAQRKNPPKIGSMVTYRYRGFYASGKPRFTSFVRVRQDI